MGNPQEGHLTPWFSQKWHLQEASSHSYEEHQRALGDPLLNATYKLLASLSKIPIHGAQGSQQLTAQQPILVSPGSRPRQPNAHSGSGMAQSSFYSPND